MGPNPPIRVIPEINTPYLPQKASLSPKGVLKEILGKRIEMGKKASVKS